MKQHITLEQLNESKNLLLRKLPIKYIQELDKDNNREICGRVSEKYFTIGKMIEILGSDHLVNIVVDCNPDIIVRSKKDGSVINCESEIELCDALWEAVKEVLKDNPCKQ